MRKNEMLFQLGSSVVSVWVFCTPPPLDGKVGNRVTKKFRFFRFTFNKFQSKDNSVQFFHHLLAMQLICDGQCTNWLTLHFYNLQHSGYGKSIYLRLSDNVDNYLLHLLVVQLICDGQCINSITLYFTRILSVVFMFGPIYLRL